MNNQLHDPQADEASVVTIAGSFTTQDGSGDPGGYTGCIESAVRNAAGDWTLTLREPYPDVAIRDVRAECMSDDLHYAKVVSFDPINKTAEVNVILPSNGTAAAAKADPASGAVIFFKAEVINTRTRLR